jgi:hypothetical protein
MTSKAKSLSELIAEADAKGNDLLARANEAAERGASKTAEKLYARGQFWLDRSNQLQAAKCSAV